MVIDSLITGEPRELPGQHPQRRPVPRPARRTSVVESICVVDGDGVRGRDQARAAARGRRAAAPPRGHPGAHRRGGACAATGTLAGAGVRPRPAGRPGRPARHRGHGRRAAGRHGRVAPHFATSDRQTAGGTRMRTRIHRARGHGPAHDPQPARGRPPGHRGVAEPAARSTPPSPSAPSTEATRPGWPGPASVVILCVPNSPEVVEVVDAMLPVLGPGPPGGRLLDHRSRGRAGPARAGGGHRRRATSTRRCRAARSAPRRGR